MLVVYLSFDQLNLYLLYQKVWKDACSQVFLTVLASSGGLITWSSYNSFYNKYQVDASVFLVALPLVSFMSAVTIFSVAGYFANLLKTDLYFAFQNATGPISPFVAYSEVVSHMWGGSQPWGIVIFATLFLSSSAAMVSSIKLSPLFVDSNNG